MSVVSEIGVRRLDRLIPDTPRPFRLYHANRKKWFLWRAYKIKYVAMRNAFWICKWLQVGETVEVIDVRTGKLHGSYTLRRGPIIKGRPSFYVEFRAETLKVCQDTIKTSGGE